MIKFGKISTYMKSAISNLSKTRKSLQKNCNGCALRMEKKIETKLRHLKEKLKNLLIN